MRVSITTAAGAIVGGLMACAPLVDLDGLTDRHGAVDGAPNDAGDASRDARSPCLGQNSGFYCGNDGLDGYAGNPSDLVYCSKDMVNTIVPCANGCVVAPYLYPDTCDPCATKSSGAWCGAEFTPALRPELDSVIFHCQNGKNAQPTEACADAAPTCLHRNGAAVCAP